MESLDWETIRCADVKEIADTIGARGMNNRLAQRIKGKTDVEEPPSPEPEHDQFVEPDNDMEDFENPDEIPTITAEAASLPTPRLQNINMLRTYHQVYVLPDSHPLLHGFERREPDDPSPYLLLIWMPEETGELCDVETCFSCNSVWEANSDIVRGTILVPCRTAMRGSFPLNETYFQVNEVFADHDSSLNPVAVPRDWIWNLPRRTAYFGTSVPSIFRGLTTEEIQYFFGRGFVCVSGFEQCSRSPKPLSGRLHFPASRRNQATA